MTCVCCLRAVSVMHKGDPGSCPHHLGPFQSLDERIIFLYIYKIQFRFQRPWQREAELPVCSLELTMIPQIPYTRKYRQRMTTTQCFLNILELQCMSGKQLSNCLPMQAPPLEEIEEACVAGTLTCVLARNVLLCEAKLL